MEKIDQQLKSLDFVEMPAGIHRSVMLKVNYRRIKPVLLTAFCLVVLNFLVIVWHIDNKLIEAEFSDMVLDFFEVLNLNFSFLSTVLTSFFEIVYPTLVLSTLFSLVGAIYIGQKITLYEFTPQYNK